MNKRFINEKKAQLTEKVSVGCALNFICQVAMHNLSEQTIWLSKR